MTAPHLLTWSPATAADRADLQAFICTRPEKRKWIRAQKRMEPHPRPWELDLQSDLRELNPRPGPGEQLWLGRDSQGLAAVVRFGRSSGDPYAATIQAVAVHVRRRGEGGACATEALRKGLREVRADARTWSADTAFVTAHIDPRNEASRRLFGGFGFRLLESHNEHLDVWFARVQC